MKRWLSISGILLLLLFLFCYPVEALEASRQGMHLWLNTLLPTLLPFMILSNLLIYSGCIDRLLKPLEGLFSFLLGLSSYGIYAFLLGLLCGYPMGAKLTADLYSTNKISRREASYLLTFTNNASPMFLSTYVVLQCLGQQQLLGPSFLILYTADFLCSLIFRFLFMRKETSPGKSSFQAKKETSTLHSPGAYIDLSIMNGFETITRLGGYILLFSLIAAAVSHFWPIGIPGKPFLLGMTEISTGLYFLSKTALPASVLYVTAMTCTAFGGLCILAQTKSVLAQSGLSVRTYLAAKGLNASLTMLLSLFFVQVIQ